MAERAGLDYLALFEQGPAACVVLDQDLVFNAATDAFLHATMSTRAGLVGRFAFDAFPRPAATSRRHSRPPDLNLPGKDGREVLAEVKADPELATIPVVILTTSAAEKDIVQSYHLHANAYVQKPVDVYQFMHVIKSIDEFFVSIVRLPSR